MLLLKAYFPPNQVHDVPPTKHPLLKSLTQQLPEIEEIQRRVIDIISNTAVQEQTRDGAQTLEKFFMGRLMRDLRGKVNASLAQEIIREEIDVHFEIIPPTKKGGYHTVKRR